MLIEKTIWITNRNATDQHCFSFVKNSHSSLDFNIYTAYDLGY